MPFAEESRYCLITCPMRQAFEGTASFPEAAGQFRSRHGLASAVPGNSFITTAVYGMSYRELFLEKNGLHDQVAITTRFGQYGALFKPGTDVVHQLPREIASCGFYFDPWDEIEQLNQQQLLYPADHLKFPTERPYFPVHEFDRILPAFF